MGRGERSTDGALCADEASGTRSGGADLDKKEKRQEWREKGGMEEDAEGGGG